MIDLDELRAEPTVEGFLKLHRETGGSPPPVELDDALVQLVESLEVLFEPTTQPRRAPDALVALRPVLASLPAARRDAVFARVSFRLLRVALLPAATDEHLRECLTRLDEARLVVFGGRVAHTFHLRDDGVARVAADVGERLIAPASDALAAKSPSSRLLVRCLARLRSPATAPALVAALGASQPARLLARATLIWLGSTEEGEEAVLSALAAGYARTPKAQRAMRIEVLAALGAEPIAERLRAAERDAALTERLERVKGWERPAVRWADRDALWRSFDESNGGVWRVHRGLGDEALVAHFVSWRQLSTIVHERSFTATSPPHLEQLVAETGATAAAARIVAQAFTVMDDHKDVGWGARVLLLSIDRAFGGLAVDAIAELLERGAPCPRRILLAHVAAHQPARATPHYLDDLLSGRKPDVDAAMRHLRSLPHATLRALAGDPRPAVRDAARALLG